VSRHGKRRRTAPDEQIPVAGAPASAPPEDFPYDGPSAGPAVVPSPADRTPDPADAGAPPPPARDERGRRPVPPPLEADEIKIVAGGTVVWFVLFVVGMVMRGSLEDHGRGWWPWCALAGAGLGLLGLYYCRRRREAIRRRHEGD
jgi:hypothetical protein